MAEIFEGVGNVAHGFRQGCAGGVGVATALKCFGDFQGFSIATAQADDDGVVAFAKERDENGIFDGLFVEQLVDDKVVVADDGVDEADGRTEFDDVFLAPFQTKRIFDAPFDFHDLQERMVEQRFELAVDESVQVPEIVGFDEVAVIAGEDEIGIAFEKEVADVGQFDEAIEFGRAEAVLLAQFVAKKGGGFLQVVNEARGFGLSFGGVMVDDDPIDFVEARFETEIADPTRALANLAHFPTVVMMSFERDVGIEKMFGEALQKQTGNEAVQITFVCEDDFRFWQRVHETTLAQGLRGD